MANSDFIGLIDCPICGQSDATVHKQQRGTKKGALYFRCYTEKNGAVMRCGTIQCLGYTGQEFIKNNMRAIDEPAPEPDPVVEPDPVEDPEPAAEPVTEPAPKKKGFLDMLFEDDENE